MNNDKIDLDPNQNIVLNFKDIGLNNLFIVRMDNEWSVYEQNRNRSLQITNKNLTETLNGAFKEHTVIGPVELELILIATLTNLERETRTNNKGDDNIVSKL